MRPSRSTKLRMRRMTGDGVSSLIGWLRCAGWEGSASGHCSGRRPRLPNVTHPGIAAPGAVCVAIPIAGGPGFGGTRRHAHAHLVSRRRLYRRWPLPAAVVAIAIATSVAALPAVAVTALPATPVVVAIARLRAIARPVDGAAHVLDLRPGTATHVAAVRVDLVAADAGHEARGLWHVVGGDDAWP